MNIPEGLYYSSEHEWAAVEDGVATIGITDYAQGELGDIVFVELPAVGAQVEKSKPCASIEAVKAVSDLFSPVSGEIVEINDELEANPAVINQDAYGSGWICKIKMSDASELSELMDAAAYKAMLD